MYDRILMRMQEAIGNRQCIIQIEVSKLELWIRESLIHNLSF